MAPDPTRDTAARWMFVSYAHKQGFGWVSINHRTISDGHDLKALNDAIAEETGHEGVCVLTWRDFDGT